MTKKEKIEKYLSEPIKAGDMVYVKGLGSQNKDSYINSTKVLRIEDDLIVYRNHNNESKVSIDNVKKVTYHIGEDPIYEDLSRKVKNVGFTFESILFKLGLLERVSKDKYTTYDGFTTKAVNFNPFVFVNGEKKFYQRDFVWSIEEMQSLIHSIYNRIECGKIVIRERGFEWVMNAPSEEEACWADVVDGKQRLTTIHKFINNEFCDKFGNYWDDLSNTAQHKFLDHQLFSYAEMDESVTDEDVIKQFLSINFTGIPQSKEHISYVESLLKK